MKGYKNQARRRKGITTTVKLKLKESIVHKTESEEDIHLTLKSGTALRPVQREELQI